MRRFTAVFASKRDKHPTTAEPKAGIKRSNTVTDTAQSSASSSSGSTSLYLQTPDDDQHHIDIVDPSHQSSKKSWKSWLKSTSRPKPHKPWQPEWPPAQVIEDALSEPDEDDDQALFPPEPSFHALVTNSLAALPPSPSPFAHRLDAPYIFPRSANSPHSHNPTLASTLFKSRLQARLRDSSRPFTTSELQSIASLASRKVVPLVPVNSPPSPFNECAPSSTSVISLSSPGLKRWISRPCFEDRYDVFIPDADGSILRQRVTGSSLAVAALEYSEALDAMVDFDLLDNTPPLPSSLVIEIPSPAPSALPASTSRNSPYIAVPSPLRNQHNPAPLPMAPPVEASQSAPPTFPVVTSEEPITKRGVRFADDGKDDVIPVGYVLRSKKQREEKAKFLRAEQQRRTLEEERLKLDEERRRRDAERAEWEAERRAWEAEKKAIDEEKRQRMYAEQVISDRQRRESQRAGGVPALNASTNNLVGGPGGLFPSSASSMTSERNRPPPARRHSRPVYDDRIPSAYLPRREASEPNLPNIIKTSPNSASIPVNSSSPHGSSDSPGSSRPPSVGTPPTPGLVPGTRPPSVYSTNDISSTEDVRAAVAAAANRSKRNSFAASMSHNNSSSSLTGDRAMSYPTWTNGNQGIPPVPMLPAMVPMMPMPGFVMMDMPLLPPTPPFMMQQYTRQHSSTGPRSGSGSSKGHLSNSRNSSRERVNVVNGGASSGSRSGHPPRSASFPDRPQYKQASSSPASGSPRAPQNDRVSTSGESRRASMPVSPRQQQQQQQQRSRIASDNQQRPQPSHSRSQPVTLSRVASAQPHHPPSPWTGLPTQSGNLPNAMPVPRQHSQSNMRTTPRKSVYS